MSDKTVDKIFADLRKPFSRRHLQWRVGQQGVAASGTAWCRPLCYIDARAVMRRLDLAVGPAGWKSHHRAVGGGVVCDLSILINGEWITRSDGSGESDIEAEKGSYSGALKRAAVSFGVAQYLYDLTADFAKIVSSASNITVKGFVSSSAKGNKVKQNTNYFWETPPLPTFAKLGIDDELALCDTQEEMMNLWALLDSSEQDEAKERFTAKRGTLS